MEDIFMEASSNNLKNNGDSSLKYEKIYQIIKEEAMNLDPGSPLGTEVGFSKVYKVSRPTVRRAIEKLIEEGIVSRIAGVGLQVSMKSLNTSKSKKILIMVNSLEADDGLFSRIVMGAVEVSNKYGYSYHILNNLTEDEKVRYCTQSDLSDFFGVITTAYDTPSDRMVLRILKEKGIPFVLVDNPIKGGVYSYVVADDYGGGYEIGRYLSDLGHKKVLFISNSWPAETTINRKTGLFDAFRERGIYLDDENNATSIPFEADAYPFIINNSLLPYFNYTAIVCSNDLIAAHVANALDSLSILIPEDISLAGFGDYMIASIMRHPLTTIQVAGYKMGYQAAKLLFKQTDKNQSDKLILNVSLVIRQSTSFPKNE